jgi:hypothetical protein
LRLLAHHRFLVIQVFLVTAEIVVVMPVAKEMAEADAPHRRNRMLKVKYKGPIDEKGPHLNHGNGRRNDAVLVQRSEQPPPLRLKPMAEPMKVMTASVLVMAPARAVI